MTIHKSYPLAHFKALDEEGEGIFEAIVSVFGNVDLIGDRVVKGAFTKSLSEWKRSGDPIPVIFDHQWGNLDAHVGLVTQAEERPEGLYIKAQLDMDEPFAARLWKKMSQRAIKEFSFAYDPIKEKRAADGANDLLELALIEVGPTLKGMNPATQLVGVKDASGAALQVSRKQYIDGIEPVEGSYEELQEDLAEALNDAEGDGYRICIVATFPDRVVYALYALDSNGYANWDEPETYQRPYTNDEQAEAITLGDKLAVEVQLNVVPDPDEKAFKHQNAPSYIQSAHDSLVKAGAACDSSDGKSHDNGEGHKVKPEDQGPSPRDLKLRAELLSL